MELVTRVWQQQLPAMISARVLWKMERRLRLLPSRVGIYFLLALGLFPRPGYLTVWAKLTAALDGLGLAVPSSKALRDLRRRIGIAPVKSLFGVLAGPLGQPRTPGIMFGRYRTVAFDGCRTIKVPDTDANRGWLGKMNAALGVTGYPVLQLPGAGLRQIMARILPLDWRFG